MPAYIVAPEAEEDIFLIWTYFLREAGSVIADRVEAELLDAFAGLAEVPGKGHRRQDLARADVYFFTIYEFMVVHRRSSPLQIVAVLHGKRDVKRLLEDRL